MSLRALYDGWALAYAPGSPAALHLLALLAALNAEIHPLVVLPAAGVYALPARAESILRPHANTQRARLVWEQRSLPALAGEQRADLLHLTGLHIPLASRVPLFLSPAEIARPERTGGLAGRLRIALSAGFADVPATLLWPEDLPAPDRTGKVFTLPPLAGLPDGGDSSGEPGYVLGLGADNPAGLRALLAGWAWASGAVGDAAPLLLAGLGPIERTAAARLAQEGDFGNSVRLTGNIPDWRALYRDAAVVVRAGAAPPWGDPVTLALAEGKPVVAVEDAHTAARVGAAAYLTPPGDDRALGAAIVTLVVETEMADALGEAAAQRAAQWNSAAFGARLAEVYQSVVV